MRIKGGLLSFFLAISTPQIAAAFAWEGPILSRSGNYCADEVEDLLKIQFGPHARVLSRKNYGSDLNWTLLVKTNLCAGDIAARFLHASWVCQQAHYGWRARGLIALWGYGECAEFLGHGSLYW